MQDIAEWLNCNYAAAKYKRLLEFVHLVAKERNPSYHFYQYVREYASDLLAELDEDKDFIL